MIPRRSSSSLATMARRATRDRLRPNHAQPGNEDGFTLIELLIVVAVLPLLVGAMTAGLLSVISFSPVVANKLSDSGDAQALSTSFTKDVQGATMVTTAAASTSPSACGAGTQILGLQYPNGQWISYSLVTGPGWSDHYVQPLPQRLPDGQRQSHRPRPPRSRPTTS